MMLLNGFETPPLSNHCAVLHSPPYSQPMPFFQDPTSKNAKFDVLFQHDGSDQVRYGEYFVVKICTLRVSKTSNFCIVAYKSPLQRKLWLLLRSCQQTIPIPLHFTPLPQ